MNWDQYLIGYAEHAALRSRDPSRQFGAAIVAAEGQRVVATGYNDLPRGVPHKEEYYQRPDKYMYLVHAEQNAIFNAAAVGVSTAGTSIYVIEPPCCECCKAIIQAGIVEIVYKRPRLIRDTDPPDQWHLDGEAAVTLLTEAKVRLRKADV